MELRGTRWSRADERHAIGQAVRQTRRLAHLTAEPQQRGRRRLDVQQRIGYLREPWQPGRSVDFDDENAGVPVDDQAGQAVVLAMREPVGVGARPGQPRP